MPYAYALRPMLAAALAAAAVPSATLAQTAPAAPPSLSASDQFLAANRAGDSAIVETASGLQYKVLKAGEDAAMPGDGDVALITYVGKFTDGRVFDQSTDPVPLPVRGVVPGFAEALKLMHRGGRIRTWIKPELGYGDKPVGPIPAGSVLVFDIELIDFLPVAVVEQMRAEQAKQPAPTPLP